MSTVEEIVQAIKISHRKNETRCDVNLLCCGG
jgi:hypothetical protein